MGSSTSLAQTLAHLLNAQALLYYLKEPVSCPLGIIQINGKTSIHFGQVMSLALDRLQFINSSFKRREKGAGKSREVGCLSAIGKEHSELSAYSLSFQ